MRFRRGTKKPVVLVVEDEAGFRLVYTDALEHVGLSVITAEDGEQAWKLLQAEPIDAVLLDLILPRLDGLVLLERMKADKSIRDIPVVVASVLGDDKTIQQAMKLGAHKYLYKGTVSMPEVARTIKQITS